MRERGRGRGRRRSRGGESLDTYVQSNLGNFKWYKYPLKNKEKKVEENKNR